MSERNQALACRPMTQGAPNRPRTQGLALTSSRMSERLEPSSALLRFRPPLPTEPPCGGDAGGVRNALVSANSNAPQLC